MKKVALGLFVATLFFSRLAGANPAPHAGRTDTDGILSRGERPNPRIDYERVQRRAERSGDYRFDNPWNEREAERARYQKDRSSWRWRDPFDRRGDGYPVDRYYDRPSYDDRYDGWWWAR